MGNYKHKYFRMVDRESMHSEQRTEGNTGEQEGGTEAQYGISHEQLMTLRKDLTQEQIEDFRGVFEMFDVDNDKSISVKELSTIMRSLGQNPTEEEVAKMMEDADEDNSGEIDFFEFCNLMAKRIKETEQDEELIEVFNLFDKNEDKSIDWRDLREVFVELGHEISEADCKLLIRLH